MRAMSNSSVTMSPSARPELHAGDQMNREEFHRVYSRMPADFQAELIGGIVYVGSPLTITYGTIHTALGSVFFAYESNTPGTQSSKNTTVVLGIDSEPQPDLFLRILPEFGGQSRTSKDDYVAGAPELVAEIALSSRSIDLHAKRKDYTRYGVQEYLVVSLAEQRLRWFDLPAGKELAPEADGIYRLRTFPGLWVDAGALFAKDHARLLATLQTGLNTPEHAAFAARLAAAKAGGA